MEQYFKRNKKGNVHGHCWCILPIYIQMSPPCELISHENKNVFFVINEKLYGEVITYIINK